MLRLSKEFPCLSVRKDLPVILENEVTRGAFA